MLTIEYLKIIMYVLIGIGVVFCALFFVLLNKINFLEDQLNTLTKNQSTMIEKLIDINNDQKNS